MVLVSLHGLFVWELLFFFNFFFVFSPSFFILVSGPLFFYSFHSLFYSFSFSLVFSIFSLIIFSLSSLFSLFSISLLFLSSSLSLLLPSFPSLSSFPFFLFSFYLSSSLFCFLNASSVLLIGHNHKVWKTLTQVKPFILHLRKPRLIEMEFSKITYYVLVINRVRFRM